MAIDEQKVISDLVKESNSIRDYNSLSRLDREYKRLARQKILVSGGIILFVYIIAVLISFIFFFKNNTDFFLWPFNSQFDEQQIQIKALQSNMSSLGSTTAQLKTALVLSSANNQSYAYIISQLNDVKDQEQILEQAITLNPAQVISV